MTRRVGTIVMAIGALHTVFACVGFAGPLGEIVSDGVLNAAGGPERRYAFWFFFAGLAFLLLGHTVRTQELRGIPAGATFGWAVVAGALLGVIVMPASGFWLLFVPGVLAIRSGAQDGAVEETS